MSTPVRLARGDMWRRTLAVLLPMMVLLTAVGSTFEVHVIFALFPLCCALGFSLALFAVAMRTRTVFLFGISAPFAVALCFAAIAFGSWSPGEAQLKISLLWWMLSIPHLALAIAANQEIWNWKGTDPRMPPVRWQFQIRSILILMATLSIGLALCSQLESSNDPNFYVFAYASAGILLLVGIAFSLFLSNLRPPKRELESNPWESPADSSSAERTKP